MSIPDVLREAATPLAILATLIGIVLAALSLRRRALPLAARIDALLPQSQCGQCGFAACRPYAEAIAAGASQINRCPPGGERAIRRLAALTGRPRLPLDRSCGVHKPRQVALIDEARCIGCTLCIQACPVDAIVGAPKLMHTVIAGQCTGCELCLPPCPVDCIALQRVPARLADWIPGRDRALAGAARERFERRTRRLQRSAAKRGAPPSRSDAAEHTAGSPDAALERKRAIVQAAIARARTALAASARHPLRERDI
ncbi:MAG: electron transport complex subunit RsxB [Burkholderiales bacterium]|nr:electron transport complex subunit RsxB [Burkholderiales bacterium]